MLQQNYDGVIYILTILPLKIGVGSTYDYLQNLHYSLFSLSYILINGRRIYVGVRTFLISDFVLQDLKKIFLSKLSQASIGKTVQF